MTDIFPFYDEKETQKELVYYLLQVNRIGQLAEEMFYLRNLFMEWKNITIRIPPLDKLPTSNPVNFAMLDIATRGCSIEIVDDKRPFVEIHEDGNTVFNKDNALIVAVSPSNLKSYFIKAFSSTPCRFFFSIIEEEAELAKSELSALGIHDMSSLVVVHVREAGYLPTLSYHSYRDAHIENYYSSIEYLLSTGYTVVRVGDATMTPAFIEHPNFFDIIQKPKHDIVDPYLISQCKFMIAMDSGPAFIGEGFGVPILFTNMIIRGSLWGKKTDLFVPKHYYSGCLGRDLTYPEIITSPALEFGHDEDFKRASLSLRECAPPENLEATMEFVDRLSGQFKEDMIIRSRVRVSEIISHESRTKIQGMNYPGYAPTLFDLRMSESFVGLNPDFLGHDWSSCAGVQS